LLTACWRIGLDPSTQKRMALTCCGVMSSDATRKIHVSEPSCYPNARV